MHFADGLACGRVDSQIIVVSAVAMAEAGFRYHHPRVVVAEDPRVLFVAGRIGGNLTKVQIVSGICRLLEYDAVFGGQEVAHGIERRRGDAVFQADAG